MWVGAVKEGRSDGGGGNSGRSREVTAGWGLKDEAPKGLTYETPQASSGVGNGEGVSPSPAD